MSMEHRTARKLLFVVGTRPELVKIAPVIRAARSRDLSTVLIHTGQHYDDALDAIFFQELDLPEPDLRLGVGSCGRDRQIERVRAGVEQAIDRERPDLVVAQGDTNSVLGAARAAEGRGVDLVHVEAGLRCGDLTMAEERNRIEADRLAAWSFAPTAEARAALLGEGGDPRRIFVTGNTVVDELERQLPGARRRAAPRRFGVSPGAYGLATIHRHEGVEDPAVLRELLAGLGSSAELWDLPVLFPAHPRTERRIREAGLELPDRIRLVPALGYLDFLSLLASATIVWTDSGGVQEEACCLGVPSVVLRESTERPEAIEVGASRLGGRRSETILAASRAARAAARGWAHPFGDGKAGERIVALLLQGMAVSPAAQPHSDEKE
ncbi:MAG: UDP-N-acetylglucosamine 2-epimerase (non-hydrolyzing) [Deltaproteobacteria bacterium]|nr:UDP-N-acetylglucosamine 2-epimerase (non-hydrolyzing) [Deltaproteobacteria bacterium]